MIKITVRDQSIDVPVLVLPGRVSNSVGYRRATAGHVGGDIASGVPSVGLNIRIYEETEYLFGIRVEIDSQKCHEI